MFKSFALCSFLVVLFLSSCGGVGNHKAASVEEDSVSFKYAKLIHIYKRSDCRIVVVQNPWEPGKVLNRYVLVPRGAKTGRLPEGVVVRVPLNRLTVFTAVHGSLLNDLNALDCVTGACDCKYIQSPELVRRVKSGRIKDMGNALNPNVERILSGLSDGLLVSPFDKSGYGTLERTGIPLIECADYMETSALGRAEWCRFFGMLVGREREADSLFNKVEKNYCRLVSLAATAKKKPTLLCDCMMGAAWFEPGAESTMGKLYMDAGADYLFADKKDKGGVRLSFETVYNRARNADVWLLKYGRAQDYTYATFKEDNAKYADFAAFKNRRIYGCNTFFVPFYDCEPFHPDVFLADAIKIFHPELLPRHQLVFFKPLE